MQEQQLTFLDISDSEPAGNEHQADMLVIQVNKLLAMLDNYEEMVGHFKGSREYLTIERRT